MSAHPTPERFNEPLSPKLQSLRTGGRNGWAFDVPRGWYLIVADLDRDLDTLTGGLFRYFQIKEKFGSLRVHLRFDADLSPELRAQARTRIEAASSQSTVTCDNCGAPGEQRTHRGWLRILCDACDAHETQITAKLRSQQ